MLSLVLFQKLITANDIKCKIDADVYKSLVEFQCDIMDMVHCIGVLRGGKLNDITTIYLYTHTKIYINKYIYILFFFINSKLRRVRGGQIPSA